MGKDEALIGKIINRGIHTFIDATVFDDAPTTETSESFDTSNFKKFNLLIELAVTNTPTDILIELEFSDDDVTFYKLMNGPFGDLRYEDGAGDLKETVSGKDIMLDRYMRVKVTATGTDATDKFALTVKGSFLD